MDVFVEDTLYYFTEVGRLAHRGSCSSQAADPELYMSGEQLGTIMNACIDSLLSEFDSRCSMAVLSRSCHCYFVSKMD